MNLIRPSLEVLNNEEPLPRENSADGQERLAHESLLAEDENLWEESPLALRVICDRSTAFEFLRRQKTGGHRFVGYGNYGCSRAEETGVTFVLPNWIREIRPGTYSFRDFHAEPRIVQDPAAYQWMWAMLTAEHVYLRLVQYGWPPERAISVLPNSQKVEVIVTCSLRELREILGPDAAEGIPQMWATALPFLEELRCRFPRLSPGPGARSVFTPQYGKA